MGRSVPRPAAPNAGGAALSPDAGQRPLGGEGKAVRRRAGEAQFTPGRAGEAGKVGPHGGEAGAPAAYVKCATAPKERVALKAAPDGLDCVHEASTSSTCRRVGGDTGPDVVRRHAQVDAHAEHLRPRGPRPV